PVTSSPTGDGLRRSSTRRDARPATSQRNLRPRSARSSSEVARPDVTVQALTLNIGAAARPRAERILEWLRRRDENVFVLTETSAGDGSKLIAERLECRGYNVVWRQPPGDRGVMLATRLPIRTQLCTRLDVTLPWRIAGVRLALRPSVAVLGVYMPSRE